MIRTINNADILYNDYDTMYLAFTYIKYNASHMILTGKVGLFPTVEEAKAGVSPHHEVSASVPITNANAIRMLMDIAMMEFGFGELGSIDYTDDVDVWNMGNINLLYISLFGRPATEAERIKWMEYGNANGIVETEKILLLQAIVNEAPTYEDRIMVLSKGYLPDPKTLNNDYWYYGYASKEEYDAAVTNATRLATIVGYYDEIYDVVKLVTDGDVVYWSSFQVQNHYTDAVLKQAIINGASTIAHALIAYNNGFSAVNVEDNSTKDAQGIYIWYKGFPGVEYYRQYFNPFSSPFVPPVSRDWEAEGYTVTYDPPIAKIPGEVVQSYTVTANIKHTGTALHPGTDQEASSTFTETINVLELTAKRNAMAQLLQGLYLMLFDRTVPADDAGLLYWVGQYTNLYDPTNKDDKLTIQQALINGASLADAIIVYEKGYRPSLIEVDGVLGYPGVWHMGYPGSNYYLNHVDVFADIKITSRAFVQPAGYSAPIFVPTTPKVATAVWQYYNVTATITHLATLASRSFTFSEAVAPDKELEAQLAYREAVLAVYEDVYDKTEAQVDTGGLNYWINELASGNILRAELAQAIINGAGNTADATIAYNKGRFPFPTDLTTAVWYMGHPSLAHYLANYSVDTDPILRNLVPSRSHSLSSAYRVTYTPIVPALPIASNNTYTVLMNILHVDTNTSVVKSFQETVLGDPLKSRAEVAAAIVPNMYQALLGKQPDTAGLNYWVNEYTANTAWNEDLLRKAFTNGSILSDRMYIYYHGGRPTSPTVGGWVNNYPHRMYTVPVKACLLDVAKVSQDEQVTYLFCIEQAYELIASTTPTAEDIVFYTEKLSGATAWTMAKLLLELEKVL